MTADSPALDPMAGPIPDAEWEQRYKARIVERLLDNPEPHNVPLLEAQQMAQENFDAAGIHALCQWHMNDPEGAADDELECWTADE